MPDILRGSEFLFQKIKALRQSVGISEVQLRSSIQQMQFDLLHEASEHLARKYERGEEFFEYRTTIESGGRIYRVVWELDWPGRGDTLHFLEVSIIETPPKLARNPETR